MAIPGSHKGAEAAQATVPVRSSVSSKVSTRWAPGWCLSAATLEDSEIDVTQTAKPPNGDLCRDTSDAESAP